MNLIRGGRDDCAGVGLYPWVARCVVWDEGAQILADSDGQFWGNPVFQSGLGCDTWAHSVEFPYMDASRIASRICVIL